MTIIRTQKTAKDPPMLHDGVLYALLVTPKLHCFYVEESSLTRPYSSTTTHGHELLFFNCVATQRREDCIPSIVRSFEYCVYEGQTSDYRNFVLQGVCAFKAKPSNIVCYLYDIGKQQAGFVFLFCFIHLNV